MKKGIDVSHWNTGLDYTTMGRSIDFVIPQEGYGKNRNAMFATHVKGFRAAKVDIPGVYHFIYSLDAAGARAEAESAIRSVQDAGLPKTTVIWCDFEYDTVAYAKSKGVTLSKADCIAMTRAFCEAITAAGYPAGIYCNIDYYEHWYDQTILSDYPVWLCDLSGKAKYQCQMWQYTFKGRISGYSSDLDMNYLMEENAEKAVVDESEPAYSKERAEQDAISRLLAVAEAEVGYHEKASAVGLEYQIENPGSANYTKYGLVMHAVQPETMDYPAAWCDCFVDWCFYTTFGEELAKKMLCGTFDDYTPASAQMYMDAGRWTQKGSRGDQIFFRDSSGICHTGLVLDVVGRIVYTIEGNKNNAVTKCQYDVSDASIAGYGIPRYDLAVEKDATAVVDDGGIDTTEATETPAGCADGACAIQYPESYVFTVFAVKSGSKGASVLTLQRLLRAMGYTNLKGQPLGVDGEAGVNTLNAIKKFQTDHGLAADGICGAKTWAALLS